MYTEEELQSRDYRIKLYNSYYTPTIDEFKPGFYFDYVGCQWISNTCVEESWYKNCDYSVDTVRKDHLKELIKKKKVRAIKDNAMVRVYIGKPLTKFMNKLGIRVTQFWKAKLDLNTPFLKPGEMQLLGVDHDKLSNEPTIVYYPATETKLLKVTKEQNKVNDYDLVDVLETKTLRDVLSRGHGLIFKFPMVLQNPTIVHVYPKLKPNSYNEIYVNGKHQWSKAVTNWGLILTVNNLLDDWRAMLSLNWPVLPDHDLVGKYCIGWIEYKEKEITIGSKTYTTLSRKVYEFKN